MKREDQERFVEDLISGVLYDIQEKLRTGNIPEEWDGHELRRYISDRFERENGMLRNGCIRGDKTAMRRWREYRNECIARNL